MLLTDLIERNAKNCAGVEALTMRMGYRTVTLNYAQVYELSCKIAVFLDQNGIKAGDKIIIFAPNSPFWVCVFFGAMLNGSVSVPANTQSTTQMIDKIIEHTQAKAIFKSRYIQKTFSHELKTFDIELIDELVQNIDACSFEKKNIDEAYLIEVLYTSGTTGDPKGVMLTHKNIYSNLLAITKVIDFKPKTECLLSVLPLTHILEQTIGLFLAFYYSAHIVYAHSYAAIGDLLREYQISKMVAVPEILKILMERIKSEAEKRGKLATLQKMLNLSMYLNCRPISKILFYFVRKKLSKQLDTIASGGAPLDAELEREWNALGLYILQGYGLTETSPVVTLNTFEQHKFASVGRVIDGVQIKLESDGQICVKGPNVFQGYYKDEAKTSNAFTTDGWFLTGDIGRIDFDGYLFLSGRKKYMILGSGGQNVFPEDIEAELNKVGAIKDSCVLGLEKPGKTTQIHAVLLLKDEMKNSSKELEKIIDSVNQNLASYQQINSWSSWIEDDFPRSATRKVKRDDVLKTVLAAQAGTFDAVTIPHSKIAKILSLVSGVDVSKINKDTRIVRDLNMDSLMRVELVIRIEQELGFSLDQTVIDSAMTVALLEDIVQKRKFEAKKIAIKLWPRSWWAKIVRRVGQFFIRLFSRIFINIQIEGLENVQGLFDKIAECPTVIFMPNHISYFDPLVLVLALSAKVRSRLSFAAAQDVLYDEFGRLASMGDLFFNSFSLPREEGSNIRVGLDAIGKMLDNGYSVVVFPEGKISLDGKLQSLKAGAGLMAIEMNVPVIPIKIEGANSLAPYGSFIPRRRARVKIKFGKPLTFKKADSYESAKSKIESELKSL